MGFVQVFPDSTGKLIDTTIVSGQHRQNICIGDPSVAAAVSQVIPSNAALPVTLNSYLPVPSSGTVYGLVTAASDGAVGHSVLADTMGRAVSNDQGPLLEQVVLILQQILFAIASLQDPPAKFDPLALAEGPGATLLN